MRKDISKFSPPQISIPASYVPRYSKYFVLIENRPPAIVGEWIGATCKSDITQTLKEDIGQVITTAYKKK